MSPSASQPASPSAELRTSRTRLKRFLRWVIAVLVIFLLAALLAILSRDIVLKRVLERRIQERTGLKAEIGSFESGLQTASFHLRDVKLYNRADFGGLLMMDMPELFVSVDAAAVAAGKLHLPELRLRLNELNIIRDEKGRSNVDQIESDHFTGSGGGSRTNSSPPARALEFAGIDLLILTINRVRYTDRANSKFNFDLDPGLKEERFTNIKTDEEIGSKLFRLIVTVAMKARKPGHKGRFEIIFEPDDAPATNAPSPPKPLP